MAPSAGCMKTKKIILTTTQAIVFELVPIQQQITILNPSDFPHPNKTFQPYLSRLIYQPILYRLLMSKSFSELSFQELFKLAEEKYESLDYEDAEYFYGLAYGKNPHDEMLVMCYANLLKITQQEQKAQQILERNIQEVPTGTYKRFMELADIYHGVQSIQTFERGIEAAKKCLANPFKSTAPEPEIKRDIAQAYAGIAEVCLTDLLEEKEAEGKCLQAMDRGQKIDPFCIDVKLQRANYLMWRDEFEAAKTLLLQLHKWVKDERQEYETETLTTLGKYLVEVEQFAKSREVFEKLHEDASNEVETIYMLAYCSFKLNEWATCEEFLQEYDQRAQQKRNNGEILDEQIEQAVAEIKAELGKRKKQIEETGQDDEWMDVEDDEDN